MPIRQMRGRGGWGGIGPALVGLGLACLLGGDCPAGAAEEIRSPVQRVEARGTPPPAPARAEEARTIQCEGAVEPRQRLTLTLLPGELVREVLVRPGQRVSQGTVLLRLVNEALVRGLASLREQKLHLAQHRERLAATRINLERLRRLMREAQEQSAQEAKLLERFPEKGRGELRRLEERRLDLESQVQVMELGQATLARWLEENQEGEARLEGQIAGLEAQARHLEVKAPFDGIVAYLAEQPGRLAPGGVVCDFWNDQSLAVRARLLQYQVAYVAPGTKVKVKLDLTDHPPISGVVSHVESRSVQSHRESYPLFEVVIALDQSPPYLRPGMSVTAFLEKAGQGGNR